MTRRVCLVTTGQPSTDPRLVKEADALAATGSEVHVVGAHWADWADRADVDLIARRSWSCRVIDWRRETSPWLFWKSRLRHRAASAGLMALPAVFRTAAASRLTPELVTEAISWPADLYIAHNLGALPAAAAAAAAYGARFAFDAEDYHRGQFPADATGAIARVRYFEERYLPQCAYVTAASPGIAAAYADLCRTPPTVVLNVSSLADRPATPTAGRDDVIRLYWFSQTIGRNRGLEGVIEAMGQVRSRPIELHLRGVWQPGYKKDLQIAAQACGVPSSRIVSHDPEPPDAMVGLAAEYDAGLAVEPGDTPNSDLALSNKIFTYLLAGLPVVATNTSAQSALARECGATGAVRSARDSAEMAAILDGWIRQPESLAAGRRAAWQLGTIRYNWEIERQVFLAAVCGAMGEAKPRDQRVRGLAS